MSTFITNHQYSLRARTSKPEAKIAPRAASISEQEASDRNDPSPASRRLFSDVVSGRKSPMLRGGYNDNSSEEENDLQDLGITKRSDESEDGTPDQNLNRWAQENPNTVRRSRSLNSLDNTDKISKPKEVDPNDAVPATDLVAAAEDLLTAAQKDRIEGRNKKVANAETDAERHPSISSIRARPSENKGKGVDPFNWGNANLDEEEMDLEAQQAALDSLKQEFIKKKSEKAGKIAGPQANKKTVAHEPVTNQGTARPPVLRKGQVTHVIRNVDSRPVRQIPIDSYIGQTLNNIHRLGTSK